MHLLVMICAGLASGNCPHGVSSDVVAQLLFLGTEWEGTCCFANGISQRVTLDGSTVVYYAWSCLTICKWTITDEGGGNIRVVEAGRCYLGIYKNGPRFVTLCLREVRLGRPTSFKPGDGQQLYTLHLTTGTVH